MECPYCRTTLGGGENTCPACQLNAERTSALLGPVPIFQQPVGDRGDILGGRAKRQLKRRIDDIERRFPQIRLRIATAPLASEHPLALHAFWLFNSGQFGAGADRNANNRTVLIVIDTTGLRAAIAPGYGLEPFLGTDFLDRLLLQAQPSFSKGAWAEGLLAILSSLNDELVSIARNIDEAFGISTRSDARPTGSF